MTLTLDTTVNLVTAVAAILWAAGVHWRIRRLEERDLELRKWYIEHVTPEG